MTTVQGEKIARRKLSLLQLAQELGNVSKACKIVGYSFAAVVLSRSAANGLSTTFVVRRCFQRSSGKS